ncbi:P27 family phage terminase small subunit [Mammaliicoccus sciuri]|uniref:P27 family phage terminase small subunit n=1 Tax=Mammaliicoccus sciuri TaxID=1296 RepID=UPI001FB43589|nr:P27 family phage terminase small subunit [Mammaliicoccus sciuri]MCJ1765833.1 P27 family phage terminase small subunit [Mammaliicoccus sciuri]
MENEERIRDYLLTQIEEDNPVHLEKIERYINLLRIFYMLDKNVEEHGTVVKTVNASQTFLKTNPAVTEKNKISASLLAIEKSFGFGKAEMVEEIKSPRDLL